MGYCPNQWISDYTYEGLYNELIQDPVRASRTLSSREEGDLLIVSGVINTTRNAATFSEIQWVSQVEGRPELTPGPYALRLKNRDGQVLGDYSFTPSPEEDGDGLQLFTQVISINPESTSLQLVRLRDDAVLATQAISVNAPEVSDVTLSNTSSPVNGVITLAWQASDADGDQLTYDVLCSRDLGDSFQLLKSGLDGASTNVDTAQLGGGESSIFRVMAHDGARTGYADSPVFAMASKPPVPRILSPVDGQRFRYGQLISFAGEAIDAQVGGISGDGLRWTRGDGTLLGTGPLLDLADLPAGPHQITLTAQRGRLSLVTDSVSVSIYVDDDVSLPPPTLTVGPQQIGWHVGSGESGPQTAEVQIGSLGGPAAWIATTDADWLTLDPVEGTAPATLTLSASASTVDDRQTRAATVTLNPQGEGEPLSIYVSLSKGDVRNPTTDFVEQRLFLPIITR